MKLIIDIGNTAAKLAIFDKKELIEVRYDSNRSLETLSDLCRKYPIEKGIFASVITLNQTIREQLSALNFPISQLTYKTSTPVANLYQSPQTLGMDRLAAVVGANGIYPCRDILIIDAGTCITYEYLDSKNRYHGGNISPGLGMRLKALHEFTDKLPLIDAEGESPDFGNTTETAIRSGVIRGIKQEMDGYIRQMRKKNPNLLVFLTGGYDFSFETSKKCSIFADKFLVLKGLNRILDYNDKE